MGPLEKMGPKIFTVFSIIFSPPAIQLISEGHKHRSAPRWSGGSRIKLILHAQLRKGPSCTCARAFSTRSRVGAGPRTSLVETAVGPKPTALRSVVARWLALALPMHAAHSLRCLGLGRLQSAHVQVIWRPRQPLVSKHPTVPTAKEQTKAQQCSDDVAVRQERQSTITRAGVYALCKFSPASRLFASHRVAFCVPVGAGWRIAHRRSPERFSSGRRPAGACSRKDLSIMRSCVSWGSTSRPAGPLLGWKTLA
jgi:hypothetical protein